MLALLLVQALAFSAPTCQRAAQCAACAPQRPARSARVSMAEAATVKSAMADECGRRAAASAFSALVLGVATPGFAFDEYTKLGAGLRGAGKTKTLFSDFNLTDSGLQYKDYRAGTGDVVKKGDRVVIDWDGVTIGYQGRYFQTRNKPKGGAFEGIDGITYMSFTVGDGKVIPGIDEAVRGMRTGGIRRAIVPEELGYPSDGYERVGPAPATFSGQRALSFVLSSKDSTMMDKTLMFDLKLIKVARR